MVKTPAVLLVLFRRPETTFAVFEAIREARPGVLCLAADGPRAHKVGEAERCAEARSVLEKIDWPCEVKTFFRDENVGAGRNVSEAVTWFLDLVGEGIILEDDCLPHQDFFRLAGECLERYRNDTRVMHISGSNFRNGVRFSSDSYVFSRYNHGWGWATWKRAWAQFDLPMEGLERFLSQADRTGFWDSPRERKYWKRMFRKAREGAVDAWDYQWKYTMWKEGGLCVYPEFNLISNLGFGAHATNTVDDSGKGNRPLQSMGPLIHPEFMIRNRVADQENFQRMYWGTGLDRLGHRWKKVLKRLRNSQ